MSIKQIIYLILAILGLIVPWYYNLLFFSNAGLSDFMNQSSANLAAKSVSLDLFIATVTGSALMYIESKRVGIKLVWLYILLGWFVSFAFALPLFLFTRETKLETSIDSDGNSQPIDLKDS